jgi:hypothetical protein
LVKSWKTIWTNWLIEKLGIAYRVTVTIVKYTPFAVIFGWLLYAIGMGLANDICNCVKEYDGWWD